ncbi:thioredoxin domain-containing protein [Mesorhizobium sp. NBSH29]|uniref:DsbA family protein n=1 Tax=Mesorhizobium sp. NBSH29 TaxID=2654249 RepID=UPI0018964C3B|nr:DsbA family protein [Mesorhizobium sp. NBSH29]QPC87858.1 thioredoxin domain-containing protein [Mesorhizobium sp. NBSH29]
MRLPILSRAGRASIAVALLASVSLVGMPATVAAQEATTSSAPLDRKEVELIVRDYLLANPEIMLEVQQALETKQKEEQRLAGAGAISGAKDEIFRSPYDAVIGNPDGKVTIVEFYDYNCGYCKRAIEDMRALTKGDPDLRYVLKEFPILGPDSQKAHVVSAAFHKLMPEKYGEFHSQLLGGQGRATEDSAVKIALSLGADEAALREAMKDPKIPEVFNSTYELATKLSISGTPSYVIGNEVVFGALGHEVLAEKIEAARACGTAC